MPTYSYACKACNNAFDIVQSFTDNPLTHCPECNGDLRKLYKNVGVVFKGSGFYRTDSRNTNSDSSSGSSSGSGSGSGSGGESTTSSQSTAKKSSDSSANKTSNSSSHSSSSTSS